MISTQFVRQFVLGALAAVAAMAILFAPAYGVTSWVLGEFRFALASDFPAPLYWHSFTDNPDHFKIDSPCFDVVGAQRSTQLLGQQTVERSSGCSITTKVAGQPNLETGYVVATTKINYPAGKTAQLAFLRQLVTNDPTNLTSPTNLTELALQGHPALKADMPRTNHQVDYFTLANGFYYVCAVSHDPGTADYNQRILNSFRVSW